MITITEADGTVEIFSELSTVFNPIKHCVLITYTVDGEATPPLYATLSADLMEINKYLIKSAEGVVQDVKLWRLETELSHSLLLLFERENSSNG